MADEAYQRRYYLAHRDRKLAASREWYRNNRRKRFELDLKKYGVTIDWYEAQLAKQNGLCALCQKPPEEGRRLAVDHCHKSNKPRKLLCIQCNFALSRFEIVPNWGQIAQEYLSEF